MNCYQRAWRYLARKKGKTFLLFLVFLTAGSMILGSEMILSAAKQAENQVKEKTKAKIAVEITDTNHPMTQEQIEKLENLPGISTINRRSSERMIQETFVPITRSEAATQENEMVTLWGSDDLELDGAFAQGQYRITEGSLITEGRQGTVIHQSLAQMLGLTVGDRMEFSKKDGTTMSVEILGIFLAGNEDKQTANTEAAYRLENQIFLDLETYQEMTQKTDYEMVSVYVKEPEKIAELTDQIKQILGDFVSVTSSDSLYQQMRQPLQQVIRMGKLMMALAAASTAVVVTLLLCMWMRSRRREMAVLLSMGESKISLYAQAVIQSFLVFAASLFGSVLLGKAAGEWLGMRLLENSVPYAVISVHTSDLLFFICMGSGILLFANSISVLPVLQAKPQNTLSEMEG